MVMRGRGIGRVVVMALVAGFGICHGAIPRL